MTVAVDDSSHRKWRERIDGLVDEWRAVVELHDAEQKTDDVVIDLTDDATVESPAASEPAR